MMKSYEELNNLIEGISNKKIGKEEAKDEIVHLRQKYGEDYFPPYRFTPAPKPWDEKYFESLKEKNMTGAGSEAFILHMAEVGEYLYKKRIRFSIILGTSAVAIVVCIIIFLTSGR